MERHDEIRRILHESGFKFKDSDRTALDMTDEEVEKFVTEFLARMAKLGREMSVVFQQFTVTITKAMEPVQDLGRMLAEAEELRE